MKEKRKLYIAPTAELLLLAPIEALAADEASDNIAMNQWGQRVFNNASIVGSNRTMWNEDGTITSGS